MNKEEYEVPQKKLDAWLIVILFFLGWLGIDKFYITKSFKKGWKFALVKLAYNLIGIGIVWNIFDIVMAFRDKYQLDFRDYFR
jgi:TM2 domain-containing membrane protein YozV